MYWKILLSRTVTYCDGGIAADIKQNLYCASLDNGCFFELDTDMVVLARKLNERYERHICEQGFSGFSLVNIDTEGQSVTRDEHGKRIVIRHFPLSPGELETLAIEMTKSE